ncbi:MAG: nucleoside hydrolase, partial [Chloroflexi bacterium]|nr:nucleoside hydrolase [Chloroflexota bacterium]
MPIPKPVIVDTDVASDDWMAILYLLRHPGVALEAITVAGTGEAHAEPGARNALRLLSLAGRPHVPVALGRETPLRGGHAFPDSIRHAVDTMLGLPLPENPHPPSPHSAVELLTSVIENSPQKVVLLALGPLTNLAEAFLAQPSLVNRLEMIYIMGGAVDVPGNLLEAGAEVGNTFAEWNIYCDPYAAQVVFYSGAPITLVPLDATNQVPVTMDFCQRLARDRHTPEAEFVHQVMDRLKDYIATGRDYFWDPLAAAVVTDESLVTFQHRQLT